MSFFSSPKVVVWPKNKSVDIYLDKKDNNVFSTDIDLFAALTPAELQPLATYLKKEGITVVSVLLNDNIVNTRSFIYDSQITAIEKEEVVKLAEGFVNFKIAPDSLQYNLVQENDKTIIRATIFDQAKVDQLKSNLTALGLTVSEIRPVSSSVASIISAFTSTEYFLLYPLNDQEFSLILSRGKDVYLTQILKGKSLEIQKIINYSNLYFAQATQKIYLPSNIPVEVVSTTTLDKTPYTESQLATDFGKPSNLPLAVLGFLTAAKESSKPAIIKSSPPENTSSIPIPKPTMDNKKNILPIIAVFVFTAGIASIIIWFVLSRNNSSITSPTAEVTPTIEEQTAIPTDIPTPTAAPIVEIDKKLKLQVLNATDINGQAASLKEKLTGLGFTSVTVGNSADKTATANTIRYKEALTTVPDYFKAKFGDYFPATYTPDLKTSSTYDVVLVIGTDLSSAGSMPVSTTTTTLQTSPTATKSAKLTPTKAATTKAATTSASPTPLE